MEKQKPKVKKQSELHPLYRTFCDAKSVAVELARAIAEDKNKELEPDVRRFIEFFGEKPSPV